MMFLKNIILLSSGLMSGNLGKMTLDLKSMTGLDLKTIADPASASGAPIAKSANPFESTSEISLDRA